MPKYLVTSGSHFEPFTYDQLVKPVARLQEEHDKTVEKADALSMEAGAIASMLGDDDPRSKALYDEVNTSVDKLVDDVMSYGYNRHTARALSDLKKLYGKNMTKVNAAITKKAEAIKQYDADIKNDKTLIAERDPRTLSTDVWLDNPYAGNYQSYSGAMLTTQAANIGSNLKSEFTENADKWQRILGGQYFQNNTFTGFHEKELKEALQNELNEVQSTDPRVATLQTAIENIYNSSGMNAWADPEQKKRALSYIGDGLYSVIGSYKPEIKDNKNYITAYQRAALNSKASRGGSSSQQVNQKPKIASLRGNVLNVDPNSEAGQKQQIFDALGAIYTLRQNGGLKNSDGSYSEAAQNAIAALRKNKYYRDNIQNNPEYVDEDGKYRDLESLLKNLYKDIQSSSTNDHYYDFRVNPAAASNIASNVFKLNIGELGKGKTKVLDSKAAKIAKYSNNTGVRAADLQALLDAKDLSIGFDAKSGMITVQRKGKDTQSSDSGKTYDDRIVYLNPEYVLNGTSALVNNLAMQYVINDNLPSELSQADKAKVQAWLDTMSSSGTYIDLRDVAKMLSDKYNSMVKNGTDNDRIIYNAMVEAFGQGLFDSANMDWKPNEYGEGWSAKTGGDIDALMSMLFE